MLIIRYLLGSNPSRLSVLILIILAAFTIACADDSVYSGDLSGKWNMVANTDFNFILDLQQSGNQITGTMTSTNAASEPVDAISGTISADGTIQFVRVRAGQWTQAYTGSVSGSSIAGSFSQNGQGQYPWSASKKVDSRPPEIKIVNGDSGQQSTESSADATTNSPIPVANGGSAFNDDPAVSSWGINRLDVFARGTDSTLWHRWWDGSSWSGWESLGGVLSSSPSAVSWGYNRIDVFAMDKDNAIVHKWWDGTSWSGWESLGGTWTSAPSVSSWGENRLDVFVRGTDNALWHKWWDGSSWSAWESLAGQLKSAPGAVSWGHNRIDVFLIGTDKRLWHKWWDGSSWSDWEVLSDEAFSSAAAAPSVSSWGENRLDVFVRGDDSGLWHKWWDGKMWNPQKTENNDGSFEFSVDYGSFEKLGGIWSSAPGAVSWGYGRIDVFMKGHEDGALWHNWWDGASWKDWTLVG